MTPPPPEAQDLSALIQKQATHAVIIGHLESLGSDHEKRIRFLERLVSIGFGVAGAIKFLWDIFITHR